MVESIFRWCFVVGLLGAELIRVPHRWRTSSDRLHHRIAESRISTSEKLLMVIGAVGLWLIPLVYLFSRRLDAADYRLSRPTRLGMGLLGLVAEGVGLWLLFRAHADLGRNWSPTLEIKHDQTLVTGGVYGAIRHPIYAATILLGIAQALMLPNWIAGPAGLVAFIPVYLMRVPREERLVLERFGQAYIDYRQRTGRILPKGTPLVRRSAIFN